MLTTLDWFGTRKLRFFEGLLALYRGTGDLARALEFLADRLGGSREGEAAGRAARSIDGGRSFSEAVANALPGLGPHEVSLLEVGERSGNLEDALRRIVDGIQSKRRLRIELVQRLAYPVLVLHLAGFVFSFLQSVTHGFSLVYPVLYFGCFYGLAAAGWWGHRQVRDRPGFRRFLLGSPLVGPLKRNQLRSRFAGALGQLYSAGIPIAQALEVVADTLRPDPVASEVVSSARTVRSGAPLSTHIPPTLADPLLSDAVALGEKAGTLSDELEKAHRFYREEAERGLARGVRIVGGVIYGLAVLVVFYLAFTFYVGGLASMGL